MFSQYKMRHHDASPFVKTNMQRKSLFLFEENKPLKEMAPIETQYMQKIFKVLISIFNEI